MGPTSPWFNNHQIKLQHEYGFWIREIGLFRHLGLNQVPWQRRWTLLHIDFGSSNRWIHWFGCGNFGEVLACHGFPASAIPPGSKRVYSFTFLSFSHLVHFKKTKHGMTQATIKYLPLHTCWYQYWPQNSLLKKFPAVPRVHPRQAKKYELSDYFGLYLLVERTIFIGKKNNKSTQIKEFGAVSMISDWRNSGIQHADSFLHWRCICFHFLDWSRLIYPNFCFWRPKNPAPQLQPLARLLDDCSDPNTGERDDFSVFLSIFWLMYTKVQHNVISVTTVNPIFNFGRSIAHVSTQYRIKTGWSNKMSILSQMGRSSLGRTETLQ